MSEDGRLKDVVERVRRKQTEKDKAGKKKAEEGVRKED